jgi:hypothetical protein
MMQGQKRIRGKERKKQYCMDEARNFSRAMRRGKKKRIEENRSR